MPPKHATKTRGDAERSRAKAASVESRFAKLGPVALENMNLIATYTPLQRPIDGTKLATITPEKINGSDSVAEMMQLPKKPRWRMEGMTAKEVQSNEESVFANWLETIDASNAGMPSQESLRLFTEKIPVKDLPRPRADECLLPSLFERNVQVYRQLWRVMDRSQIVLVLLDSRCPLLHLPAALERYLQRFARRRVILVLTKKDIVGNEVAQGWKDYLESKYEEWPVVASESYARLERLEGQGSRTRLTPYLSESSRKDLIAAIRQVHAKLLTPPPAIQQDTDKLEAWEAPCSSDVDWSSLERHVENHGSEAVEEQTFGGPESSATALTVGLIGQPNVGKSSLLNALVGSKVVRASRTPGKTKTFQTHQLGQSGLQLCDCPGLVFPSQAGQELQVFGSILPISQVQAVTTVVRYLAAHLPLEEILQLDFPPDDDYTNVQTDSEEDAGTWTATRILEALCRRHGYKTAKAGRWDLNRAGNALLRTVAEGRIQWAFRPPTMSTPVSAGDGIWLRGQHSSEIGPASLSLSDEDDDDENDDQNASARRNRRSQRAPRRNQRQGQDEALGDRDREDESDDDEEEGQSDAEPTGVAPATSMFDALAVEGGESSQEEEEGEDEDNQRS
ncbi:unnamed protein product [Jaminaea pallidilutea]